MTKPIASMSLDLDNKWSYMKTHGDAGWEAFPSYLELVVPRVLELLDELRLRITFFIVGQDAALEGNRAALRRLADAGHEIGNHSFRHEPWLHLYSPEELAAELDQAEAAIESATGVRPRGFRGPGYSFSRPLLDELARRGYAYDASTFPTFLGPVARLFYFFHARLSPAQRAERKRLFGRFSEGFRTLRTHVWPDISPSLVEIPVTTMPIVKTPIHVSYLVYLGQFSPLLARWYFSFALAACRATGVEPSLLLHPLDFLGGDDEPALGFFPGMNLPWSRKRQLTEQAIRLFAARFNVLPMHEHAARYRPALVAGCRPTLEPTSRPAARGA